MTKQHQISLCIWFIILLDFTWRANACGYPGSPAHAFITFSTEAVIAGTVATYKCDRGFELLGPARRVCAENGTWSPPGMPFCVLNVAIGKAPMQSSVAQGGYPQKAIDGSSSNTPNPATCTMTEIERASITPWWYVNLLEAHMVQLVRVDFGRPCCANNVPATVTVRVGNSRPDSASNPICNRYIGPIEVGRPLFLPCSPPMPGAFVSVHWEGPPGTPLSICEAFVYTDQAIPVESCPSFRDQPLGGTATFNGKCYIFYNNQPTNFAGARRTCESRGGTLVDETSLILQGFLSWELWQRHRNEPSGQYWMGATRDPTNPNNWKWINGIDVKTSFWNLPGGNENCSRFDGTKGWLWSDTNCNLNLNFICQHKPLSCGHPAQPPNSTLAVMSRNFIPGTSVRYICNPGDLLIGPERRTCQPTGYFNEYPPTCRHLECGLPAEIPNGLYQLLNGTKSYMSMVRYSCNNGYVLIGRGDLTCDVDEKWDGPPPRCEPSTCPPPIPIPNGYYATSTNFTVIGTILTYFCNEANYALIGHQKIVCTPGGLWSSEPPICQKSTQPAVGQVGQVADEGFALASSSATSLLPGEIPAVGNETPNSENPSLLPSLFDWLSHSSEVLPQPQPQPPPPSLITANDRNKFEPINSLRLPFSPALLNPISNEDSASSEEDSRESFKVTDPPEEVVHTGSSKESSITFPLTTTTKITTTKTSLPQTTSTYATKPSPVTSNDHQTISTGVTLLPNIITSKTNTHSTPKDNNILSPSQSTSKTKTENDLVIADISNIAAGRLNTGGIIALSVFGGFVILAAVITIVVIVYRRKQTPRGSVDNVTVSTYESGSEHGGLTKYYKRAWEDLRMDKGNSGLNSQHKGIDNYHQTAIGRNFEGMRDSNEMTVSDSAAWSTRKEQPQPNKPRHHHHHHHHRPQQRGGSPENDNFRPWYTRNRR